MDFAYFKNNYRLIAADLSKQKALDADSRAIQLIIFTGKIKSIVAGTKVIIYFIRELSMETILQFSKTTDAQLKKFKTAVKNKTRTTLTMNLKMLDGNELPHELLQTTRQKAKLINAFNNNMLTDLKLSKA